MAVIVGKVKGKELFRRELPSTKPTVIGRGKEADIRIEVTSISRQHTRIDLANGRWVVSDMGSTNGTLVNGKKISAQPVGQNDRIQIGTITLEIVDEKKTPDTDRMDKADLPKSPPPLQPRAKKAAVKSDTGSKTLAWIIRLILFPTLIYCAWGYYQYITLMREAIRCRNNAIELYNEEEFSEAITALEKAGDLEKRSQLNLFVKYAYPYLPQRELPIEEDLAICYYEKGNSLYNNQEKNLDGEALKDFETAFRLKPDIPGLAKTLCQLAFVKENWQLALDSAEEASKQGPKNVMVEKIRDIARKELDKKRDRP